MKLTSAIAAAIILTFSAAATAAPAGAALPNADLVLKSAPVPTTATVAGRAAPLTITPHKLGALELGLSAEEAVDTGYLFDNPDEPCGLPAQVIDKYAAVVFVAWKDDDTVDNILIKAGRWPAPGWRRRRSTVAQMREGHPGLRPASRVDGDGGGLWIQAMRRGQDWLIFGLTTPENRTPRAADRRKTHPHRP